MLTSFSGGWADEMGYSEISNRHDMQLGRCPRCSMMMGLWLGPANTRIDCCGNCGGLFLDQGELSAMRSQLNKG